MKRLGECGGLFVGYSLKKNGKPMAENSHTPDPRLTPVDQIGIHTDSDEPYYRTCDFCYHQATDDIHDGKLGSDWRKMYKSTEETGGLIVCADCVEAFQSEDDV